MKKRMTLLMMTAVLLAVFVSMVSCLKGGNPTHPNDSDFGEKPEFEENKKPVLDSLYGPDQDRDEIIGGNIKPGDSDCAHHWAQTGVGNMPTCYSGGVVEVLCKRCGEYQKQVLPPTEHAFKDGACIYCGRPENTSNTRPEEKPDDGKPEGEKPEGEKPDDGTPEDGKPEGEKPDDGRPEDGKPEGEKPDDGKPEDGKPEGENPDDGKPDDGTPEDGTPDDGTPEGEKPEGEKPEYEEVEGNPDCEHFYVTILSRLVEPTCDENGRRGLQCTLCGKTMTVPIPATGAHDFEGGNCTVCDVNEAELPCVHQSEPCEIPFDNACGTITVTYDACSLCHAVLTEPCVMFEGCIAERYENKVEEGGLTMREVTMQCTVCGFSCIQRGGNSVEIDSCHSRVPYYVEIFNASGGTVFHRQDVINNESHDYENKYYDIGNCETDGYTVERTCRDCGKSVVEVYYHHVNNRAYVELTQDYGVCGNSYFSYRKCNRCGEVTDIGTLYIDCAVAPTESEVADENGVMHTVKEYSCAECGLYIKEEAWTAEENGASVSCRRVYASVDEALVFDAVCVMPAE